ncbi:MAG: hypothetical protein AAF493_23480 [Pseudomonadota bacterium]
MHHRFSTLALMHRSMIGWLAAAMMIPTTAVAGDSPWARFFGTYAGRGDTTVDGELTARDLSVKIQKAPKGFSVSWTTVIRKVDGRIKRKDYTIRFVPTQDQHLYSSAMRVNMFGKAVPLDPMKGEPYVWATLKGDTLTVHALELTDTYGYEMQVYERRLTDDGLALKFSRVRDGERLRDVHASLVRIPE